MKPSPIWDRPSKKHNSNVKARIDTGLNAAASSIGQNEIAMDEAQQHAAYLRSQLELERGKELLPSLNPKAVILDRTIAVGSAR